MEKYTNPIIGQYNFKKEYFNNPKRIYMEPKKKINWARIWQIIRDIILAALTADTLRNL